MTILLWFLIGGCFFFACVTDCRRCLVYNITWWIAGAAVSGLLLLRDSPPGWDQWIDLLLFVFLQFVLFDHMYGRGDVYAFSICAYAGMTRGFSLMDYLLHMFLSVGALALVQGLLHNIGKNGNLKKPVPFLPYITLAFCALLWYHYIC